MCFVVFVTNGQLLERKLKFFFSGDHPITATAIARQIGLIGSMDKIDSKSRRNSIITVPQQSEKMGDESNYAVICGEEVNKLSDRQWDDLLKKDNLVFARTTPEMKLQIVEQCQKRDEIVAVTG